MTDGPFAVDVEAALDALDLAWGDEYDEIWISDGKWNAHHKDAGDDDVLTGVTPRWPGSARVWASRPSLVVKRLHRLDFRALRPIVSTGGRAAE